MKNNFLTDLDTYSSILPQKKTGNNIYAGSSNPYKKSKSFLSDDFDWLGDAGALSPLLSALSGFGQLALGNKALKQGKNRFNFTKGLTKTNLNNQAKLTNAGIRDRQIARETQYGRGRETEGFAANLDSFIQKNKVRGSIK